MSNTVYFRYKEHPGDFFRSKDLIELPNPNKNMEDFLIQFLKNYQSDQRIAYLNDLYKLDDDNFCNDKDKRSCNKVIGNETKQGIKDEIQSIETELKKEAYLNFYHLVLTRQIDLVFIDKVVNL